MKKVVFFILLHLNCFAQTGLYNGGNMQLHNNAQVGFYTNIVNDGTLNHANHTGAEKSDVYLFAPNQITDISGTNRPLFYNLEIDALNDISLNISLGVTNSLAFMDGIITTPKNTDKNITLDFLSAFHAGQNDDTHLDGFATVTGVPNSFTFPIGDGIMNRPMTIAINDVNKIYQGAYFFEDLTSSTTYDINTKQELLADVSPTEYWELIGDTETTVTLTWNNRTDIPTLTDNIDLLRVVGWSKTSQEWVNLGVSFVNGDVDSGQLSSEPFIPDNYEIITIGTIINDDIVTNGNNIPITPNDGNGQNDTLIFKEIEEYNSNSLTIMNRWGSIVYEKENYANDWAGISTGRATIGQENKLPAGTYFYMLRLGETPNKLHVIKRGWVYLHY